MAWRLPDGTLRPLRCGASNRCDYCAWLAACENAVVVKLDADVVMPTVGLTLTTADPGFDLVTFRRSVARLFEWLRRRHPDAQYLGLMEWTTGSRTPGRRPHMHALVKGLDRGLAGELHAEVSDRWKTYTGGSWVVECRPLRSPGGAIAYLTLHHHKREQAPPEGFRGKRLRPSKGYYSRPIGELRSEARGLLTDSRVRQATARYFEDGYRARLEAQDVPADVVDDEFDRVLAVARAAPAPELVATKEMDRMDRALRARRSHRAAA